ncbi:YbhB/YbcL family Raf kinase inhibitor-like protein [soil metagenome]|jgi:Raf kinase inhibitor-like YbhB/YbcL family protein|nr:YbhB/YbcL family Raf kinase inhibitor-like protein [Euzebyaceae bacterium]
MAAFRLTSAAFDNGEEIPIRHTSDGDDVSPPLSWSDVPDGTRELALICDDPDADAGVLTHWLVYGMAPGETGLPEGIPRDAIVEEPVSLVQGLNEFDEAGYSGPLPAEDRGPHRYFFRLFALDAELDLPPGVGRSELRRAAKDHTLAQVELVGIA